MKGFTCSSIMVLLATTVFLSACNSETASPSPGGGTKEKTKIVIWGLNPTVPGGDKNLVEEFNKTHPNIELVAETVPTQAGQDAISNAKLLTAVTAGNPPDLATLDRFLVGTWALNGALEPLDPYLNKDALFTKDDFVPATWGEVVVNNKTYAVPYSPGAIGFWSLAYNKDLFVKAGIVDEKGEAKPPSTWQEVMDDAKKLTIVNEGKYQQIGMLPLGGASFLYQWGWANGANYITDDGHKVHINTPEIKGALDFLTQLSDQEGGAKQISTFTQGFTGAGNDPFYQGKVAMEIIGDYALPDIAKYAPKLNFGVTFFPKAKAESPTVTWGGGWSLVIPKGSKHPKEAWEAINWLCSKDGILAKEAGDAKAAKDAGGTFIPIISAYQPVNDKLKELYYPDVQSKAPNVAAAYDFFVKAPNTYQKLEWRPHNPAADILWQALIDTAQSAVYHEKPEDQIMKEQEDKVQKALDDFWSNHQ